MIVAGRVEVDLVHHPTVARDTAGLSQYSEQIREIVDDTSNSDHTVLRRDGDVI